MIIGITGSIGSGKTTVAKLFSKHHFNIINADEIGHSVLKNNLFIKKKLIENFGNEILGKNKRIDREELGKIVFNDKRKLKKLNSIMHPVIFSEIKNRAHRIIKKYGTRAKIIIDAPLLLETNVKKIVDHVIVVQAEIEKITERNKKFSKDNIKKISEFQMPMYEKIKYADFIIYNNGDFKNLENQVMDIIGNLEQ